MKIGFALILLFLAGMAQAQPPELVTGFDTIGKPFLQKFCISCHGGEMPSAELDLSRYSSIAVVAQDPHLSLLIERMKDGEMPPVEAKAKPTAQERSKVIEWFQAVRAHEVKQNAGDPGIVLARRLSNAEYDNTIGDLTGVDIRPTRDFPADPSNSAGFDNSGESLMMSPALLGKYLKAAQEVASHMFLTPQGFGFAPHPMLAETDRDKYCIQQIIQFYRQQNTNYVDYFLAAWRYKNRRGDATLASIAAQMNISAKYLGTIWNTLEVVQEEIGPGAKLQALWRDLPADEAGAKQGCEQMRDYVVQFRRKVEPRFLNLTAGRVDTASQPLMIWKNVQYATHRMKFDPSLLQVEGEPPTPPLNVANEPGARGEFGPGRTVPVVNVQGDPDLAVPAGERARYEEAFARFCRVFPDMFYMEERGRNYFNTRRDRGRYLSAGYHSLMGYFRDDQPLYELMLDEKGQKELDGMWLVFDFMARATERMYLEFYQNGTRQNGGLDTTVSVALPTTPGVMRDMTSEKLLREFESRFVALSQGDEKGLKAISEYFDWINGVLRSTERARREAEPRHLEESMKFAARAYRRPLTQAEKDDLLNYYKTARDQDALDHEAAIRELIVAILMSPDAMYRINTAPGEKEIGPLSDYELASRLSYFLWSGMPDDELLAHAAAGTLHEPAVITAQAKRMLRDPKVRRLAMEFGGNWLEFRKFQELASVDRTRFSTFSNELRDAMFEEPVRFLTDVMSRNRSILDLLYADDTFVNATLARHYGMPEPEGNDWVRVSDANKYERGGILPMAAFLTKNSPGLRTSPVKRGNWVVMKVLGEHISPPPALVPELPQDEAKLDLPLRDMLAQHREVPACAACHDRFDAMGLVFEGFGPIGEVRKQDLAGRAIDASATFPDGAKGTGVAGLKTYIKEHREAEFVETFSRKLLAYALGRSLILTDDLLVEEMRSRLKSTGYRFEPAVESIVTSPQFLNKRRPQ